MVRPECDAATLRRILSLEFRDLVTVTLMLRKPRVTTDTWLYVHDEDLVFARIHEPKNWSPDMVPGADVTSVVCECFCTNGDATWRRSDTEIAESAIAGLADTLGFIRRDEVLDWCVVRTRHAYPVYDLEYREKTTAALDFLARFPGIHVVGRGGAFRYNNADHSIEMGQLLAKTLLGEAKDHMSVNTEQAYLEEIRRTFASARR
jgi:protoporphyrinogen oxidase